MGDVHQHPEPIDSAMTFSPSGVNPALLIVAVAEHIPRADWSVWVAPVAS